MGIVKRTEGELAIGSQIPKRRQDAALQDLADFSMRLVRSSRVYVLPGNRLLSGHHDRDNDADDDNRRDAPDPDWQAGLVLFSLIGGGG